jgi:sulfate adenylyltransferase (ADP) / ATP adenylyltransferase
LIVTNEFESQQDPLNSNDLAAAWLLCRDLDGLAFFNAGPKSGASQPHKHLQFIPLPIHPEIQMFPIEQLFDASLSSVQITPKLPFVHFAIFWPQTAAIHGEYLHSQYNQLLDRLTSFHRSVNPTDVNQVDYNLIMTKKFMLVAPRSREHTDGVFVNSLGFAASIFVKTEEQYQTLLKLSPLTVLSRVGYPKSEHETLLASL